MIMSAIEPTGSLDGTTADHSPITTHHSPGTNPRWYEDAVFYALPIKAFADGNHDGVGDFIGLKSKLDYLAELGVTCLWLLPFQPSPLRDFYIWRHAPDDHQEAGADGRACWAWDPVARAYYWHRFFEHQPDLNYLNPTVCDEMSRVLRFWL